MVLISIPCDTYLMKIICYLCDTYLMIPISALSLPNMVNGSISVLYCLPCTARYGLPVVRPRSVYLNCYCSHVIRISQRSSFLLAYVIRTPWESSLTLCDTYLMRITSYLMWYVSHENHLLPDVIRTPWESPLTLCDMYPMILISVRSPINNCLISVPILERMIYNGSNLNPMWYVSHENHLLSLWHVSHDSYIRPISS